MNTKGLVIKAVDDQNYSSIDFFRILKVIEGHLGDSQWVLRMVDWNDFQGELSQAFDTLSASLERVSTARLLDLTQRIISSFDGDIWGFRAGTANPWIYLRALDGSHFCVTSSDSEVIEALVQGFTEVVYSPYDDDIPDWDYP